MLERMKDSLREARFAVNAFFTGKPGELAQAKGARNEIRALPERKRTRHQSQERLQASQRTLNRYRNRQALLLAAVLAGGAGAVSHVLHTDTKNKAASNRGTDSAAGADDHLDEITNIDIGALKRRLSQIEDYLREHSVPLPEIGPEEHLPHGKAIVPLLEDLRSPYEVELESKLRKIPGFVETLTASIPTPEKITGIYVWEYSDLFGMTIEKLRTSRPGIYELMTKPPLTFERQQIAKSLMRLVNREVAKRGQCVHADGETAYVRNIQRASMVPIRFQGKTFRVPVVEFGQHDKSPGDEEGGSYGYYGHEAGTVVIGNNANMDGFAERIRWYLERDPLLARLVTDMKAKATSSAVDPVRASSVDHESMHAVLGTEFRDADLSFPQPLIWNVVFDEAEAKILGMPRQMMRNPILITSIDLGELVGMGMTLRRAAQESREAGLATFAGLCTQFDAGQSRYWLFEAVFGRVLLGGRVYGDSIGNGIAMEAFSRVHQILSTRDLENIGNLCITLGIKGLQKFDAIAKQSSNSGQ